jgi:hypothetical protein
VSSAIQARSDRWVSHDPIRRDDPAEGRSGIRRPFDEQAGNGVRARAWLARQVDEPRPRPLREDPTYHASTTAGRTDEDSFHATNYAFFGTASRSAAATRLLTPRYCSVI